MVVIAVLLLLLEVICRHGRRRPSGIVPDPCSGGGGVPGIIVEPSELDGSGSLDVGEGNVSTEGLSAGFYKAKVQVTEELRRETGTGLRTGRTRTRSGKKPKYTFSPAFLLKTLDILV